MDDTSIFHFDTFFHYCQQHNYIQSGGNVQEEEEEEEEESEVVEVNGLDQGALKEGGRPGPAVR